MFSTRGFIFILLSLFVAGSPPTKGTLNALRNLPSDQIMMFNAKTMGERRPLIHLKQHRGHAPQDSQPPRKRIRKAHTMEDRTPVIPNGGSQVFQLPLEQTKTFDAHTMEECIPVTPNVKSQGRVSRRPPTRKPSCVPKHLSINDLIHPEPLSSNTELPANEETMQDLHSGHRDHPSSEHPLSTNDLPNEGPTHGHQELPNHPSNNPPPNPASDKSKPPQRISVNSLLNPSV